MRNVFLFSCVLLAACNSSPFSSPTTPSSTLSLTDSQTQASGSRATLVVSFTKWITSAAGAMAGVASIEGVAGAYTGQVTGINQINEGLGQIDATYNVSVGDVVFSAAIEGKQNQTGRGVLNGLIQTGSYAGARVHVEYQQTATGCPTLGLDGFCYIGTIQVMTGSAQ